jgi:rhodanese-related sulfurtransferase
MGFTRMRSHRLPFLLLAAMLIAARTHVALAQGPRVPASSIPTSELIQPEEFAKSIQSSAAKPVILQVGSHIMFAEAHIPGAEYAGPAGKEDGLQALKERIAALPKSTPVVLYCGCCPWGRCPNIAPAYNLLHEQGFNNLKVLYIAEDFGSDWVAKGYPVAKGR